MTITGYEIGEPALFDTCIMLDYLRGIEEARNVVRKCPRRYISDLTWMEIAVSLPYECEREITEFIIQNFTIIILDRDIAQHAVFLRREKGLNMPGAILYASACVCRVNFITRNIRDFDPKWPDVCVPYKLDYGAV